MFISLTLALPLTWVTSYSFPDHIALCKRVHCQINICTLCFLFQYSGITSGAEIWNRKPFEMQNNKLMYKQNAEKSQGWFWKEIYEKAQTEFNENKSSFEFSDKLSALRILKHSFKKLESSGPYSNNYLFHKGRQLEKLPIEPIQKLLGFYCK